ncbi:MAG: class II aldolase/adducin family protein [Bacteroidia bacterium]
MDEGYIKFELQWEKEVSLSDHDLVDLQLNRQLMYQKGFIGWDDTLGVGYGNISQRSPYRKSEFIISGTQTGELKALDSEHFCLVNDYDIQTNRLWCKGPIKASSESMTHAAIYAASDRYHAVIHIHHRQMWEHYYNQLPTTDPSATYGTPEMARAIGEIAKHQDIPQTPIIIMGGHQDGIMVFGANLGQVADTILEYYRVMN